jgi:hypothetical protein
VEIFFILNINCFVNKQKIVYLRGGILNILKKINIMKRKLLLSIFFISVLSINTVCSAAMENIAIAGISASYIYTGAPIVPAPVLRDGMRSLKKDVDYTLTCTNNVNVGTATIEIKGIGNYTGGLKREFKITKARLVVTIDGGQTKVYGAVDPKFTYKITSGELKGSDVLKGNIERAPGEDIGVYPLTQGTLTAGDNYELMVVKNNFKIEKAVITIKPSPGQNKVYGQQSPEIKYTIVEGSLMKNDVFTGSLNHAMVENVGTYSIMIGTLTAGKNYDIRFIAEQVTFEILKADITVKPDAGQSKTFGSPDPPITYTITSGTLLNNDAFKGGLGRQAGEDVGKYDIQQGTLTLSNNYNLKVDLTEKFEIVRKSFGQ